MTNLCRLSELTSRSGDLEEQISLIEVKLRRSQAFFELFSRDFGNKIEKLGLYYVCNYTS